jgi:hypothetical protein
VHEVSDSTSISKLLSVSFRNLPKLEQGSDVGVQVEIVVALELDNKLSIKSQVARATAVKFRGHEATYATLKVRSNFGFSLGDIDGEDEGNNE